MVRIGIAGAGVVGKRHVEAIRKSGVAELVAIADPAPGARELAKHMGVSYFPDVDRMMEAERPAGVVVATPTEHHLEPSLTALMAGAHVLVEKPVTASVGEAGRLIEAARAADRHVLVGHHRRHYHCVRLARDLIVGEHIGILVAVTGQWTVHKHEEYYEPLWRRRRAAGPVLTNLIHDIDCLRAICGEIVSVTGEISNSVRNFEKEDAAAIVMKFANGALGTFIVSDCTATPWSFEFGTGENPAFPRSGENAVRFIGTEGALEFPNLTLWRSSGVDSDWNTPMSSEQIDSEMNDAFMAQILHFCDVVRGQAAPLVTAAEGARSLAATVAVFEAAESGKRVLL